MHALRAAPVGAVLRVDARLAQCAVAAGYAELDRGSARQGGRRRRERSEEGAMTKRTFGDVRYDALVRNAKPPPGSSCLFLASPRPCWSGLRSPRFRAALPAFVVTGSRPM
jgi:hypothetical protein